MNNTAMRIPFPGCVQTSTPKIPAAPVVKNAYLEHSIRLWATASQKLANLPYLPRHNGSELAAELAETIGNCNLPLAAWVHKRMCDYTKAPFLARPYPPYNFVWSLNAFAAALEDLTWARALDQPRIRLSPEEQSLQRRYQVVTITGRGAEEYMKQLRDITLANAQIQTNINRDVANGCYVW